jgi:hypothetical protein
VPPLLHPYFFSSFTSSVYPVQFYIMAAKDKVCALTKDMKVILPDLDLNAWVDKPSAATIADHAKYCSAKEQKWIGAPDKTDELLIGWGPDVCADAPMAMMSVMPFVWYFVFYLGLWSYFIFNIWSLKEELAKGPKDDTEMGVKPAVAVATATPAVAVATATVTA